MDTEALKKSLLVKFVEVTQDRLQAIQLGILDLEKPESNAAAEGVARELHTMKGEARMLGLAAIGQLAHCCEDLLKAEREKKVDTPRRHRPAAARLRRHLRSPRRSRGGQGGLRRSRTRWPASSRQAAGTPLPPLKPVRPRARNRSSPPPAKRPPPSALTAARAHRAHRRRRRGAAPSPPAAARSRAKSAPRPIDRSIRVNVEILDALGLLAGDLLVESARSGLRGAEIQGLFERFSRLGDQLLRLSESQALDEKERERAAQLESDLHLLRDDAFRFVRSHADGFNTLHGNLTQMADHVAEARLIPLASVFEAFPRAARDLAHAQNKHIDMVVENTNAGVDRSLVADLRDALVHLLRNSVDHGIEGPDTRSTLGKPETGRIVLRARADGDMLHVEVEDDGRGIDPAAAARGGGAAPPARPSRRPRPSPSARRWSSSSAPASPPATRSASCRAAAWAWTW